jgi:Uncharacterized conserved protein
MVECKARLDLPYPEPNPGEKNPYYANEMLGNVGGANSEMTAIASYIYAHVILGDKYKEYSGCFHKICVTEMTHLDLFSELALALGADPRLWERQNFGYRYWSPSYVAAYPRELRPVIENALAGERAAIQKYQRQTKFIKNANIVEILERIIKDEELHVTIFEAMLAEIGKI